MKLILVLLTVLVVTWGDHVVNVESPVQFSEPEYDKLSWFVHITDIHISSWEDESRQSQVKYF